MEEDDQAFTPLAEHIMNHLIDNDGCEVFFTNETAIDVTGPFDIEELATSVLVFIDTELAKKLEARFEELNGG